MCTAHSPQRSPRLVPGTSGDDSGRSEPRVHSVTARHDEDSVRQRSDVVAVNTAMHHLATSPDPEIVFSHLAELMVPALCDAAAVRLVPDNPQRSDGEPAGQSAAGGATRPTVTRGRLTQSSTEPAHFSVVVHVDLGTDPTYQYWGSGSGSGSGSGVELVLSWWVQPPRDSDLALLDLVVRCAAGAVASDRHAADVEYHRHRVANLTRALESNRTIGAAIGVLMVTRQLTYQQGFDLLSATSQRRNRKIADLAAAVLYEGDLPQ